MIQGKTFGEQPLQLSWWVIVNIDRNVMLYELPRGMNCFRSLHLCFRFIGTTPVDLQTQLSTEEAGAGSISEVGSDILLADPDDDYQPLDPAYLPPGLEDDDRCEKVQYLI